MECDVLSKLYQTRPNQFLFLFYNDRFELVIGFNTKQPWVYDGVWDVYIDPPSEVLDRLPNWRDDDDKWYEELQAEVSKDPEWLYDRDYWYEGEIEI